MSDPSRAAPGVRSRPVRVQWVVSIAVFMVPFMGSGMNLALPQLGAAFGLSPLHLAFVVSTYLVATAIFQAPAARAADLRGRRRVFLAGLAAFSVCSFGSAGAWSGASLVAWRFAAGAAGAMVFATNMAILAAVFPASARGRVFGINSAVVYGAAAIGPVAGGFLAHYLGWRSIFAAGGALSAVAFFAGRAALRDEWTEAKGESFDFPGAGLYGLALAGVMAGFSTLPSPWGWALLGAGAALSAGFVAFERRRPHPVVNLELFFTRRIFRLSALTAMINYAAASAVPFLVGLYLQFVRGLPARDTGLLLMVQPAVQMALSPFAGRWSDRIDPSWLTSGGMALITAGLLWLGRHLTPATPFWELAAALGVIGAGFGLFASPNGNLIMGSVPRRSQTLASATIGTVRLIGQSLSLAIATMAIHAHLGSRPISPETGPLFMPSLTLAFHVFAGCCLAGIYTSAAKLFGRRDDRNAPSAEAR